MTKHAHWLEASLKLIQECYLLSISESTDIINVIENLQRRLLDQISEIPPDESPFFIQFLSGLEECKAYRNCSFEIMDFSSFFITTMDYLLVWMMHRGFPIDAFVISRRKALSSDLNKILKKSIKYAQHLKSNPLAAFSYSTDINDRFGSTIVINNRKNSNELIYRVYEDALKGVLCGESPELRADFIDWCTNNPYIFFLSKNAVLGFLSIDFHRISPEPTDYIASPKPNNYQALQDVLEAESTSHILPKCKLDIHLTDSAKNDHATLGEGNHSDYKDWFRKDSSLSGIYEILGSMFSVPAGTETEIPGYKPGFDLSSIPQKDAITVLADSDGVEAPVGFSRRHLSPSLCKRTLQYKGK